MDELDDFDNPGVFEGAAGFDGFDGADGVGEDTVSSPVETPPISPSIPPPTVDNLPPPIQPTPAQPRVPSPTQQPPSQPVTFPYLHDVLDTASGALVGYVVSKDPKDRAANIAMCAAASYFGGVYGLGIACYFILRKRGR